MNRTRLGMVILAALVLAAFSCTLPNNGTTTSPLAVKSVTSTGVSKALTGFTHDATAGKGFIVAGSPDYLELTLTQIDFFDASTLVAPTTVWSGSKILHLDGSTAIDTSDMTFAFTPGHVGTIRVTFANSATFKGSLTGDLRTSTSDFATDTQTVYTKAALPYVLGDSASGGADYTDFTTAPAEAVTVPLSSSSFFIDTSVDLTIAAGDKPSMTLLVDLSRVLRFYDGRNDQGVNPSDPAGRAYFFCHSVIGNSIACFFGSPGSIQGYEAYYVAYEESAVQSDLSALAPSGAVPGWMTLIFDGSDNIIAGILSGDDDNAYTVGKGRVGAVTPSAGLYEIPYALNPDTFMLHEFTKASTVGTQQWFRWESPLFTSISKYRFGEVMYTLKFSGN